MEDLRIIIEHLAVKYDNGDNRRHSQKVARLALDIFDQMAQYSNFTQQDRLLLEFSALVHDIGAFINDNRHASHTSYVILNDSLTASVDSTLRLYLAIIAGSHRRGIRKQIHDLSSDEQGRLKKLISLLRIADALDYDRQDDLEISEIVYSQDCLQLNINCNHSSQVKKKIIEKSSLFQEQFEMTLKCFDQD